jgi:hypothetical protein
LSHHGRALVLAAFLLVPAVLLIDRLPLSRGFALSLVTVCGISMGYSIGYWRVR